ncbi:MAG: hypothetical protein ACQKBT_12375 [Puniceicoccales bacterium]
MKLYDLSYDQLEMEYPCEAADAFQNISNLPGLNGRDLYELVEEGFAEITEGVEAIGADIVAVGLVHNRERLTYPPEARGKFLLKAVSGEAEE